MKKVLILPLYGIGDVLMTTPAIRNLKEQFDAEITYLHMFKTTRDILMNNPFIAENIHFPFLHSGKLANANFILRFRKKFDISINFYPSNRRDYNLASFIAGSPVRIGHRYRSNDMRELNFLKTATVREDDGLHCVEENLRLLDFFNLQVKRSYPLEIYLTEEEKSFSERWLKARNIDKQILVGIHPGTSIFKNHDRRRWPEDSFARIIDELAWKLEEAGFLLFGGPEEKPLREKVISLLGHKEQVFSVDDVSVREAASLMRHCNLFISNDSGPMHMAAASGVPTVAVFGPTNPAWVRPWGVKQRIVRAGLFCSPCFRYSPKPLRCDENRDYECLNKVRVEQVLKACLDLLGEVAN
ncbi:MAG: glycosyltransferase family 9 protein [Candidatus Sulfobium sp.]